MCKSNSDISLTITAFKSVKITLSRDCTSISAFSKVFMSIITMGTFTRTWPADCHMPVHLISWYAVNVCCVFCASCSITCVRPWNAITPKASDSSILCLPPSSSPPSATSVCFSLVFPNVNSLEGYRGVERIPDIFPSPLREATLSLWSCNKTQMSRRQGEKERYLSRHVPHPHASEP